MLIVVSAKSAETTGCGLPSAGSSAKNAEQPADAPDVCYGEQALLRSRRVIRSPFPPPISTTTRRTKMNLKSLDELEKQIETQILRFNQKRQHTRRWRNSLLISQVMFTAITTFIISANIKFCVDVLNIVAVACSVTATVLGIFLTSFMFHDRLHVFTLTSGRLQGLLARLKMQRLRYADDPAACPLDTSMVE